MSVPANIPGLNFQLGDDIDALRDAVRDFARAEIAPRATEIVQLRVNFCTNNTIQFISNWFYGCCVTVFFVENIRNRTFVF